MSGAGSLVDLDQQIISHAKYKRQTDPNGGGRELDQNKHKRQHPRKVCIVIQTEISGKFKNIFQFF